MGLQEKKKQVRAELLEKRKAFFATLSDERKLQIQQHYFECLKQIPNLSLAQTVGCYWAVRQEAPTDILMDMLHAHGCQMALPRMSPQHFLTFLKYQPGDQVCCSVEGVCEPSPLKMRVFPQVFLMPLVGFHRDGTRLGTGRGYYDKFFSFIDQNQKIVRIGIAFACQETSISFQESHDIPLDYVVTEKELIACTPAASPVTSSTHHL